ncbi:hypothetical protein J7K43_01605 [Candidatus Calescamantes bacterium]|nr:hypothetical protein [Candidatus Calescamantes bacterium]
MGRSRGCKIPYLLTTIYSLPATGSMVDSSEYMVDGGMVRKKHTVQDSLSTNYYLLATSIRL